MMEKPFVQNLGSSPMLGQHRTPFECFIDSLLHVTKIHTIFLPATRRHLMMVECCLALWFLVIIHLDGISRQSVRPLETLWPDCLVGGGLGLHHVLQGFAGLANCDVALHPMIEEGVDHFPRHYHRKFRGLVECDLSLPI